MASPQTHNWELLAQLALCGQDDTEHIEPSHFVQHLVDVLRSYLPFSWGLLVAVEGQHVANQSGWGLSEDVIADRIQEIEQGIEHNSYPLSRFSLCANATEVGYLLLPPLHLADASPEAMFYDGLAAQLGMLLALHMQRSRTTHASPDHACVSSGDGTSAAPSFTAPAEDHAQATPHLNQWDQVDHATLFEEQQQQLKLLQHVSTATVLPSEQSNVYHMVLEALVMATHMDQARLVMYEYRKNTTAVAAEYALNGEVRSVPVTMSAYHLEWLAKNQQPLVVPAAQHDPMLASMRETFAHHDIRSLIVIPLVLNGEMIGYAEIYALGRQVSVSSTTLDYAQAVAYQAARVVENERLFSESQANARALQDKVGELSTLLEAAHILGSLLKPDEVLNNLMELVRRQLGVTTVALWTIGNDNSSLAPAAMYGIPRQEAQKMQVPIGKGLTGKVAETGMPLIVNDVNKQQGSLYPDFNRRNSLISFMGVPVFYHERIVGVLSVMTDIERSFTTDEVMLLGGLAGQAAIALENARLFQERERRINELTSINEIGTAVNATLDLDETLLVLQGGIGDVLDTQHSFIGIYEIGTTGETSVLKQRVIRDGGDSYTSDTTLVLNGRGLVDYVLLEGKPLLLSTTEEITTFAGQSNGDNVSCGISITPSSWLGVPIMLGDEILGIITLQSHVSYAYSEDDMRFLTTVASQAAVAIGNARLFSDRERRLREITVLKDIGSAIASTLNLPSVLDRLYHELSQAIDMSTSLIGLYHEQTNTISYPVCYNHGKRLYFDPEPLNEDSPGGWAIRNRQPMLLHTAEQGYQMGLREFGMSVLDLRSPLTTRRYPHSMPIQSFLVTPILSGDEVLGLISVKSYKTYAFDEDDLRFMMTVANQLAVTISNIRLFQEREQRIEELATFNDIGQSLSSTVRSEELPTLIYRQTSRLMDTSNFYIALYDDEQDQVTFPVFYEDGFSRSMVMTPADDVSQDADESQPVNPGLYVLIMHLTRRVIDRRGPIILQGSELRQEEWDVALKEEMGTVESARLHEPLSWLGVPMIVADKVVGVMGVLSYTSDHAYTSYDLRLLSTIASWAGISLENAHLFDQISQFAIRLERRVAERTQELEQANVQLVQEKEYLETVHTVTLELTATLDLDEIISRALEIASNNLNVARGSIMLRELQSGTLICRAVLQDQGVVDRTEYPIAFRTGEGLVGWVMQHQEPLRIDDVLVDMRWVVEAGRAEDVRSVMAVPLMTSDTTLGVLILTSPEVNYFTDSQLRLLSTIGNEIAIAINNAQLYSYITEMATRLADLLEQQKEETSKSRAILQSLTEGVVVLDPDLQIELFNAAADQMLNISTKDVLNQPMHILETYGETESEQRRARTLYTSLQTGLQNINQQQSTIYSMSVEFPYPLQNIAMNVAPVIGFDGRGYGTVAVLRDITREIESDRAKREFISKVSHELRTPLTAIRGYVDLLLIGSSGMLNEDQTFFLKVVKTNTNRLMELINDILDMSRIESGKIKLSLTEVSLSDIIKDVLSSWGLEADAKDLGITVEIADDLPTFIADEKRITQVIFNLFSNAVKYTYEHGHITVRAFLNPAQMIQVEVEDTGVGMSPEQLSKLFRPFYRADNPLREQVGGTGLGLSISKSLIDQHNGEMWVTSEEGKGSIFHFILPLEQPEVDDEEDGEDE
jgi:GAF domain-containing protein/anti-sigma regulatory factor (Ser/Thr protein kinase)